MLNYRQTDTQQAQSFILRQTEKVFIYDLYFDLLEIMYSILLYIFLFIKPAIPFVICVGRCLAVVPHTPHKT